MLAVDWAVSYVVPSTRASDIRINRLAKLALDASTGVVANRVFELTWLTAPTVRSWGGQEVGSENGWSSRLVRLARSAQKFYSQSQLSQPVVANIRCLNSTLELCLDPRQVGLDFWVAFEMKTMKTSSTSTVQKTWQKTKSFFVFRTSAVLEWVGSSAVTPSEFISAAKLNPIITLPMVPSTCGGTYFCRFCLCPPS